MLKSGPSSPASRPSRPAVRMRVKCDVLLNKVLKVFFFEVLRIVMLVLNEELVISTVDTLSETFVNEEPK